MRRAPENDAAGAGDEDAAPRLTTPCQGHLSKRITAANPIGRARNDCHVAPLPGIPCRLCMQNFSSSESYRMYLPALSCTAHKVHAHPRAQSLHALTLSKSHPPAPYEWTAACMDCSMCTGVLECLCIGRTATYGAAVRRVVCGSATACMQGGPHGVQLKLSILHVQHHTITSSTHVDATGHRYR